MTCHCPYVLDLAIEKIRAKHATRLSARSTLVMVQCPTCGMKRRLHFRIAESLAATAMRQGAPIPPDARRGAA